VESGKLLILVAGDRTDVEQARPVLEQLGEITYAGAWGNAQRLKLIANSMLGIISAAAAELLAAGTAAGLDGGQVFSILTRFAPGLAARERGFLHGQHTPTMFAVRDLVKDLDLFLDASRLFLPPAPNSILTIGCRPAFFWHQARESVFDAKRVAEKPAPGLQHAGDLGHDRHVVELGEEVPEAREEVHDGSKNISFSSASCHNITLQ